ncbi:hypothetical protein M3Y97_00845700 [Aphelenchoides bicaudatus]|nr:hypothetical protein M3Y97_00845700 [Aphelenchoides bicaudatus]
MGLPNDVDANLQALSSIVEQNQTDLYTKAAFDLLQVLIPHAGNKLVFTSNATTALCSLLNWLDIELVEQCKLEDRPEPSTENGQDLIKNLQNALENSVKEEAAERAVQDENSNQATNDFNVKELNEPDSIDGLLKQLALRKIEKFVPKFPDVVLTDSEDEENDDVKIDEQSEHRIMRHGSQTTQQEVERRQNGQEVRTKKVSTMNSSKSSKTITIKISGKGAEDLLKKFQDQKADFDKDEDFEQEITFPTKQSNALNDHEEQEDTDSNDLVTKTKTVQHNAATLQAVSRQAKRNGRLKMDQFSQKLDLTDLNARQGNQLVDRKGEGTLLESSVIQNRLGDQVEEWSIILPPRKHVEHYIKTIEGKDGEDSGNFFRATALESYIALNQNLITFEEQQHRQINYSFGLTGTKAESAEFSLNLRHLTSSAGAEDFIEPALIEEEQPQQNARLLSITEKAGVLESLDASDYLVFQQDESSQKEVRGGPCEALVVHASSKSSLLFQEAFITTFPGFIDAEALIKKLVHRYYYMTNLQNPDAELFNKIEISEMLWWAANQVEQKCPNIQAMTNHFNNVSYWMRTKLLELDNKKEREKRYNKFLKVAKHLRKLGNFNGYLATLSALDSGPVRRLNWPQSLRDQVKSQVTIMDTRQSFKNYRTELAKTKPPCLPYFGLILQDLTFVHLGNPEHLTHDKAKNLLNFGKRWQQYAILDNVRRFGRWSYDIEKDDKIVSLFNEFNALPEEETWSRSYELVPRNS